MHEGSSGPGGVLQEPQPGTQGWAVLQGPGQRAAGRGEVPPWPPGTARGKGHLLGLQQPEAVLPEQPWAMHLAGAQKLMRHV